MNPTLGWALAALFVFAAWQSYGWHGLAFAASAIVFWLLLQFNRTIRVMKNASHRPVGRVESAVMFHSRLRRGATLLSIVAQTKSLGTKIGAGDDDWAWTDEAGDTVRLHFTRGRLERWSLERAAGSAREAAT